MITWVLYEKADSEELWMAGGDDNLRETKYHSRKEKKKKVKKEEDKNDLLILPIYLCLTEPSRPVL